MLYFIDYSSSCSSVVETRPQSPQIDHPMGYLPTPEQARLEHEVKRRCVNVQEGTSCSDANPGLMNQDNYRSLTPHQALLFEPAVDLNNIGAHHYPGIAYGR